MARAADRVVAALKRKDAAAVQALATASLPDPWRVADELCGRGEHDAAKAFADATAGKDVAKLPGYVVDREDRDDDAALRVRIRRVRALLDSDKNREGLEILESVATDGSTVSEVLRRYYHALALQNLGRYRESEKRFLDAAELAESIGWLRRAQLALGEARISAWWSGRIEDVYAIAERSIRLARKRGNDVSLADGLIERGIVLSRSQHIEEGREDLQRALELAVRAGAAGTRARALQNMALNRHLALDFEGADEWAKKAIEAKEQVDEPYGLVGCLMLRSGALEALGRYGEALDLADRGRRLSRRYGMDRPYARLTSSLAELYARVGNFGRALFLAREGEAVWTSLESEKDVLRSLKRQASYLATLGRDQETVATLARFVARGGGKERSPKDRAVSQAAIGGIYREIGRPRAAIAAFARAREAAAEAREPVLVVNATFAIAEIHNHEGRPEKAIPLLREALDTARSPGQATAIRRPSLRVALAAALAAEGDLAGASEELSRAMEDCAETGQQEALTQCRMVRSQVLILESRYEEAIAECLAGIEALQALALSLSEEQLASIRERFLPLFEAGIRAAVLDGDEASALRLVEYGRADALIEALGGRTALRPALLPEPLARREQAALRAEAAAAEGMRESLLAGSEEERARARRKLREARFEVRRVVEQIQREARGPAEIVHPLPASTDEIRGSLRPGEVLVVYALLENQALAVVVRRSGVGLRSLPSVSAIEEECGRLILGSGPGSRGPLVAVRARADPGASTERLEELVVAPLGLGPEDRTVLVSPHGCLAYVPFCLLLGDREVSYVPSGTALHGLRAERRGRGRGVLALGAPDYSTSFDPRDLSPARSRRRLPPLPGTGAEARAVGDVVLLGSEASETRLLKAIGGGKRWRSIHLACHGLLDPEQPTLSSLVLTPDEGSDGFLTALDVVRTRFLADLVVLSACETGRGRAYKSGGIVGLSRAFMFAGSSRVLCSLWKVDDEATGALMTKLYELWNPAESEGLPLARALRKAQEHVRSHERWKHPYYWAAWVLWGLP